MHQVDFLIRFTGIFVRLFTKSRTPVFMKAYYRAEYSNLISALYLSLYKKYYIYIM